MSPPDPFARRDCPACGAPPPPAVQVASAPPAETLAFEDLIPHWNGFFERRVFFSYVRCRACGLLFAPTFFDTGQLAALYAQMAPNMDLIPEAALRRTQRGYFEVLKAHARLEGGYLEVGPDIGLFTANCVREGRFDAWWLYEPNREVAPALSAAMAGAPHAIIHDMDGFGAAPAASVGAAVMIHVLDHLLDPAAALRDLRAKLTPEGRLLIVVHDESSALARLLGRRWPAFCLQHPEVYSRRSLRALLERAGYRLVTVKRTVNHFPVQFLLKHLLWACGLKAERVPAFGGFAVGLELGNLIAVAAPDHPGRP
ncbi:MAG: class I SAM-dependent methyltransferase [Caulobacteraceae bacterium]|nr:class I SAM-dependent methyltransferase [Caulobacteraceae bacterium]